MVVPPEFLKSLTKRLGVSDGELEVLLDTLEGEDLNTIAQKLGIQRNALQKRLGEVYRKFRIEGSGPGKFAKLQKVILEEYQKQRENLQTDSATHSHFYWENAPIVGTFYGRKEELSHIKQYLIRERCPLVALLGMGGIGKSVFTAHLVEQIATHYDHIIWRNLPSPSVPTLETLLTDLMIGLQSEEETEMQRNNSPTITDLIAKMQRDRCLIILDQFETLFQEKNWAGYYQKGYESYGELLKQIAQTRHQSSLLILSRETPLEVMSLAGNDTPTRIFTLKGFTPTTVQAFLTGKGLNYDDSQVSQLISDYSGHPVALNQIVTTVQTLFNGNLQDLFATNTIFVGEILAAYFSEQLNRLSPLEEQVINQIAIAPSAGNSSIAPQGLTLNEIANELPDLPDLSYVIIALNSLDRRCLLEKFTNNQVTKFTLIPLLKKHIFLQQSTTPKSHQ